MRIRRLDLTRFGKFTEFGHTWLNVIQAPQIKKYGLFNLVYLARNLACAFALTPVFVAGPPFIRISYHGLAMWVTTPVILAWRETSISSLTAPSTPTS